MRYLLHYFQRILPPVVCALMVASAQAQTKPAPSPEQDDVIRVNTELVQTDVMVFDKKGQFVDGLKAGSPTITIPPGGGPSGAGLALFP